MPRRPRIILPGVSLHGIQRGNNRHACFYAEDDYLAYLGWLEEYARHSGCAIHAYVLMTNHVHVLLTPKSKESAGDLMKRLGQRYVQYVNRTYRRSGTLWEGRFRSCLTGEERYVLGCSRLLPVNRTQSRACEHGGTPRTICLVKLPVECPRRSLMLAHAASSLLRVGRARRPTPGRLSRAVPAPSRSGVGRRDRSRNQWELCAG